MINKIDSVNLNAKASMPAKVKKQANKAAQNVEAQQLSGAKFAQAYQAMNGVSFGAKKTALTAYEQTFIGKKEIRIPNLLDIKENLDIPYTLMPADAKHLNSAGLNVEKVQDGTKELFKISNDKGDRIFEGVVDKAKAKDLPVLTYKQGKFMPEITVKDTSVMPNKSIKMLAGSTLEGEGEVGYKYSFNNVTWTEYTGAFTFDTETKDTVIYAKAYNKSAETAESDIATYDVRLDKTAPVNATMSTVVTTSSIEVTIKNVIDNLSGIKEYEFA